MKFLKKDKDGNHFDARQRVMKNTETYYDGLCDNNDLVSKTYVDTVAVSEDYVDSKNGKQDIAIADKDNRSEIFHHCGSRKFDMNGKEITNLKPFGEDEDKNEAGHVIDFSSFHEQRGILKRTINEASSENVPQKMD